MPDYNRWWTADLLRYQALLRKQVDSAVLPECALSGDEVREIERYKLGIGITPHIDTPRPVVTDDEPRDVDVSTRGCTSSPHSNAGSMTTAEPASAAETLAPAEMMSPAPWDPRMMGNWCTDASRVQEAQASRRAPCTRQRRQTARAPLARLHPLQQRLRQVVSQFD